MSRQTNERLFCWQFDRIARLLLSIIGRLHQRRLAQWNIEFVKVDSKVFHIRNKLSKHCPIFLRYCQSGKNSSSLVPLFVGSIPSSLNPVTIFGRLTLCSRT